MMRYGLALAVALALPVSAGADTGHLAGVVQLGLWVENTSLAPDGYVVCVSCYENVSRETITMQRPGAAFDYLFGENYRLFDAQGLEIAPTTGMVRIDTLPGDLEPLVLEPGQEYFVLGEPEETGHEAHWNPGHYRIQVRFYYFDEPRPSITNAPNVRAQILAWREEHFKYLESNIVWFERLAQQGKVSRPRLLVNDAEVAGARPLRVGGVLYAHPRDLPGTDVSVDAPGAKVVVKRGAREVTLPLGKWNPKRDRLRPALRGGGVVYVPLRQVATALGLRVNWDPATQTVDVRS
jgi:hypothetical protein